jgi:hypothetical protein
VDLKRFDELRTLLGQSHSLQINDSRLWIVRGKLAERDGQKNAVIRCFWEAFKSNFTNRVAAYKLFRFLNESKNQPAAEAFQRRVESLHELSDLVVSKDHTNLAPIQKLIEQLESMGRFWEA